MYTRTKQNTIMSPVGFGLAIRSKFVMWRLYIPPFLRSIMKIVWKILHDFRVSQFGSSLWTSPRAIYLHQSNCFGSYGKRASHWRSVDMFCMMRVNTAYSVVDLTTWYERETIRLWTHFVKLEGYQKLDYFIFCIFHAQDQWKEM